MSLEHTQACPVCKKRMGIRVIRKVAERKPLGPNRDAAIAEAQPGWCCVCDTLPIKASINGHRGARYTCGEAVCKQAWRNLASLDIRKRKEVGDDGAAKQE